MVSITFKIFAYIFGALALFVFWRDLSASDDASIVLGQFWFESHAPSLQVSEAIISRYIDPCGLIIALGCDPFLWHPLISTTLGWPAALVFVMLTFVFSGLSLVLRSKNQRRVSGKALKRSGR